MQTENSVRVSTLVIHKISLDVSSSRKVHGIQITYTSVDVYIKHAGDDYAVSTQINGQK